MEAYVATCIVSGKQYTGKTTKSIKRRWAKHVSAAKRGSPYALHRAIRKYGADSFVVWTLPLPPHLQPIESDLNEWEKLLIKALGTFGTGYNMTEGGEGQTGLILTEETRRKISEALRKKKGHEVTEETRGKIAQALLGHNVSEQTRTKLSEALRGKCRPHSDATRKKMSEIKLLSGLRPSEECVQRSADIRRGQPLSEEHVRTIADNANPSKGSEHYAAKLTEEQVSNIRGRYAAGEATQQQLAAEVGVCREVVKDILHNKTWKHLPIVPWLGREACRPVINIATGIEYPSVTAAAKAEGFVRITLYNMLSGHRKNKTALKFGDHTSMTA